MRKVYSILEKDPNEEISVEEFIECYVAYEEKLKIKNVKLEKSLDELTDKLNRDKEYLNDAQDERDIGNGVTNKSYLYISIIEAKDLTQGLIGECSPYVSLLFEGEEQHTQVKKNTSNPGWNENFEFKLKKPEGTLRVEVFDKSILGDKSLGYVCIDLESLKSQGKLVKWFELFNGENTEGKINMKVQCIINLNEFFKKEINDGERKISFLKNAYDMSSFYVDKINEKNFGLIYSGNLDYLLDYNSLNQIENVIEDSLKDKKFNFSYGTTGINDRGVGGSPMKAKYNFRGGVTWNKPAQFSIIGLLVLTLFTLLERSDFVNFFVAMTLVILFVINKNSDILKILKALITIIGVSLGLDILWLLFMFGTFMVRGNEPEIGLKRIVYIVSIVNFVIKGFLCLALFNLRKKKESNFDQRDGLVNNLNY